MTIEVFWRLPMQGDGRALRHELWNRGDYSTEHRPANPFARTGAQRDGYTFYDHLSQIAGAADLAGFDGLWIPQSDSGEEPLVVAGAFAREARRLTFVPALRAPLISAVYAAKIAVSFQRMSAGRLAWYLHVEPDEPTTWHGRHWSLSEQIERTGEFLDVVKGFWHHAPFSYRGKYFEVENGGFPPALQGETLPLIYLAGESPEAFALSARHADVHVLALDTPQRIHERIAALDKLAGDFGRTLRYALAGDLIARDTDDEAWADLRRGWDDAAGKTVPISAGPGWQPSSLAFDGYASGANLWAGFAQLRPGGAAGLVGSYAAIADRIADYAALGIDTFVLTANPALEEAYRIGEKLLPRIHAITTTSRLQAAA